MSWEMDLNDETLEELYEWIDKIPLSRPKKRIERDFSDGYCVGEIIRHFLPQFIEMHNLTPANNLQQKLANWGLLNSKVFTRFGLNVPFNITQNISNQRPGYIEVFLYNLRYKIEEKLNEMERSSKQKMSPRGSMNPHLRGSFSPGFSMSGGNTTNRGKHHQPVVTNEMRLEYEQKVQECLQQAEQIEILQAKIRRLEHLLELKEARIDELTDRLDKYRPTGMTAEQPGLIAAKKSNAGKNRNSIMIS